MLPVMLGGISCYLQSKTVYSTTASIKLSISDLAFSSLVKFTLERKKHELLTALSGTIKKLFDDETFSY